MKTDPDKTKLLQDCRRFIIAHLDDDDLTPEMLAQRFHYEYSSFRAFFKEITGFSIHEFIRLKRIHKAAHYLCEGGHISTAARIAKFNTRSGFNKAFFSVYGVSASKYAASRGTILMDAVTLETQPDRYIVGYAFPVEDGLDEGESSAYWLGKEFPDIPPDEYNKIGGGAEMIGLWSDHSDGVWYILGPPVEKVHYVPAQMRSVKLAGGMFAVIPVPKAGNNQQLSENFRSTWFYAYHQWLPSSGYMPDDERTAYEYYLSDRNSVCIPVKPVSEADPALKEN
ncbi:MAG: AraC family transcriptional regulator [Oscillospiraceae bacterium]|nr:AraC family transcriptional regulator [Oscillospiraceae bacterium]